MVTNPAQCPIPPGFSVIGNFNDDFHHFKNTIPYSKWEDANGNNVGPNTGVSKRWRNPIIRSTGIVCGFQFKIGPNNGERWFDGELPSEFKIFGKVTGGDVNLFFPRRDGPGGDRGSYLVSLKWFVDKEGKDLPTEGELDKKIPHGKYAKVDLFTNTLPDLLTQPTPDNPKPVLENPSLKLEQIKDGQWHNFLGSFTMVGSVKLKLTLKLGQHYQHYQLPNCFQ
jgi:hypothetical protein